MHLALTSVQVCPGLPLFLPVGNLHQLATNKVEFLTLNSGMSGVGSDKTERGSVLACLQIRIRGLKSR